MLKTLLESRKRRSRPVAQAAASLSLHLIVVVLAIQITASADTLRTDILIAEPMDYELDVPQPASVPPAPASPAGPTVLAGPIADESLPLPPTLDIPSAIPSSVLEDRVDPRAWADGRTMRSGAGPAGPGPSSVVTHSDAFLLEQVDQPVEPIHQPAPRYPPTLQQMGVSGRVVAVFVVDTTGMVEPDSWRVLGSTHAAFEAAAREAVFKSRFRPARIRGRPVRQLVQQALSFQVR